MHRPGQKVTSGRLLDKSHSLGVGWSSWPGFHVPAQQPTHQLDSLNYCILLYILYAYRAKPLKLGIYPVAQEAWEVTSSTSNHLRCAQADAAAVAPNMLA